MSESLSAKQQVKHIEEKARMLLRERDTKIINLNNKILELTNRLKHQTQNQNKKNKNNRNNNTASPKKRNLTAYQSLIRESESKCGARRRHLKIEKSKLGRNASLATSKALAKQNKEDVMNNNELPNEENDSTIQRVLAMFKDPGGHVQYLKSELFARDLLKLCNKTRLSMQNEPRCVYIPSPCYVFGDIHGNLEDLHFFSDNIWRLGMSLTAGNFLFLGDYVDRGKSCLEVLSYLFAMKVMLPNKVFLLRGNHETRDVNGWEEHYGDRSFIYQCRARFGDELGYRIWEQANLVFDRMPLAAVIDQDIFCVHGGIPRHVSGKGRINDILNVPKVVGINPPYDDEHMCYQQVASDCIWSDPASEEQERKSVDVTTGFGDSLRGGGAICFGNRAVTDFLQEEDLSYIMRAHEAHADGVAVSKGARVFTVFSTSKDHNQGNEALAGCVLVDFEKLQVINRSPAYRNRYIHRRDSVSIAMLSDDEINQRVKLGLIIDENSPNKIQQAQAQDMEEWQDFDDDDEVNKQLLNDTSTSVSTEEEEDDDENLCIDTKRLSSVDPCLTIASPPGSSHDSHEHNKFSFQSSSSTEYNDHKNNDGMIIDSYDNHTTGGINPNKRLSCLNEVVEEDDEDEEGTVNGEEEYEAWDHHSRALSNKENLNNKQSTTSITTTTIKKAYGKSNNKNRNKIAFTFFK